MMYRPDFDYKAYFKRLMEVWDAAQGCTTLRELDQLCITALPTLGVTWYSLMQSRTPEGHFRPQQIFGDLSHPWTKHYLFKKYFHDDPINRAVMKERGWFTWSDVWSGEQLSKRGEQIFAEAQEFGLNDGLVVPIRFSGINEALQVFSVAGGALPTHDRQLMGTMATLLMFIQGRAMDVIEEVDVMRGAGPVAFSHGQLDVLVRVGEGMPYHVIAEELDVSEQAIKQRMTALRRKIGVDSNEELIAYAISTQQMLPPISFSDYTRVYVKGDATRH